MSSVTRGIERGELGGMRGLADKTTPTASGIPEHGQ
jgi:hypothetical protein